MLDIRLGYSLPPMWSRLLIAGRARMFRIAEGEVSFDRRRFVRSDSTARAHLERAGKAFVYGYNAAMRSMSFEELSYALAVVPSDLAGFSHEGSAMALALIDLLMPFRRSRWQAFAKAASEHVYLIHVGAGWALARTRRRRVPPWLGCDPLLEPLVFDGFGFHETFFRPDRVIESRRRPSLPDRGALCIFDQGVGRSLWFVNCADAMRIAATIASFEPERHPDLWSGVGLAAAYAGGVPSEVLAALADLSMPFRGHVAQGVAFAARARQRAGNLTPATELAARIFCGVSAADAADVAESAARALPRDHHIEAYEQWRRRIREAFTPGGKT